MLVKGLKIGAEKTDKIYMYNKDQYYDVAIIGGGITGLSLAYTFAQEGQRVAVFEKDGYCKGASIRNFGMIWPIGQPLETLDMALESASIWKKLSSEAGFWMRNNGSLHVAYHEDEWDVLKEFHEKYGKYYNTDLISGRMTGKTSAYVQQKNLIGALHSPNEINVDPRQAIPLITKYLQNVLDVTLYNNTYVIEVEGNRIHDDHNIWKADRIIVCTGHRLRTLFPDTFTSWPLMNCKLQMMQLSNEHTRFDLGPNLAAGLTLQHYKSFEECKSLTTMKRRLEKSLPEYLENGIHVMVSQNSQGDLIVGDSHHYDQAFDPFISADINQMILKYLRTFLSVRDYHISQLWYGIYTKSMDQNPYFFRRHSQHCWILTGLGGAGMTLSFGLAKKICDKFYH